MIVAGGTYREECVYPKMDALLGSGGRAAIALRAKIDAELHTFFPDDEAIKLNFGRETIVHRSGSPFSFHYLHPLALPRLAGQPTQTLLQANVEGNHVLRFGCVEGNFKVDADEAVYDPQGSGELFSANGSNAQRLAIVLNEGEAEVLSGHVEPENVATTLVAKEGAEAVVIKRGASGCLVATAGGSISQVPAFRTRSVFKIGSGDIFSASFSYAWMNCGMTAHDAALFASSNAAMYVESRNPSIHTELTDLDPVTAEPSRMRIAVVSDQETMLDHWLASEAHTALHSLGVRHIHLVEQFERERLADILGKVDAIVILPRSTHGMAIEAAILGRNHSLPTHVFDDRGLADFGDLIGKDRVYGDLAGCLYNSVWQ